MSCWKKRRPAPHDSASLLASRGLKQKPAAKILGVTQPRVSDLLRGRIDLFSTDALIDILARLGAQVRLKVKVLPAA